MDAKLLLKATAGAMLGNWVADRYVFGTGMVEVSEGLGVDDVVRALCVVAGGMLVRRIG